MGVNKYTENIKKIKFVITYACNSRCRHCLSVQQNVGAYIGEETAAETIRRVTGRYTLEQITVFGGEPLLYPETLCSIYSEARDMGIPRRRLITSGGLCDQVSDAERQADMILTSGVTEVLLSVDTFHMEFIPLIRQHTFAKLLKDKGFEGLRLHPVWVAGRAGNNLFNLETQECLKVFRDLGISVGMGTVIRPEGNAKKYIERFYKKGMFERTFRCGDGPETERLDRPVSISIHPNGDVRVCDFTIGNIYREDILDILEDYNPFANPMTAALAEGGINGLQTYMESLGFKTDLSNYYTPCEFCSEMQRLHRNLAQVTEK